MEEILNQLSNPFNMDNFKKLINLYLESKDIYEFYSRIVTYYQDRDMEEKPKNIFVNSGFITFENMGHWRIAEYFSDFFPTEHRIYINSSLASTGPIIQMFMDECISQNLPFELKYAFEANSRSDGIVIGSNTKVYKKHIDILRKIAEENPELKKQCGTPHILTASLDDWMGLADENVSNRYKSYTQSRIDLLDKAMKSFLLKHMELGKKVEDIDISEIYEIFQEQCRLQGINPDMPILYEGSKEELLRVESSNKDKNHIQTDKKSPISIINEYFAGVKLNLSVEDELQLLKLIDEKFYANSKLMDFMFDELEVIMKQGLINQDVIKNNLFSQTLSALSEFRSEALMIKPLTRSEFPGVRSMIVTEGDNISKEQAKEIINTRISQLYSYFNKSMESVEEKKKCIDTLQKMLENYETANPNINYDRVTDKFEAKIKYLEFEVQNYDALKEEYKIIASSLEGRTCTDEEIKHILEDFKPKEILVDPYYELWGDEPKYRLEHIPEIKSDDLLEFETALSVYLEQEQGNKEISFSGQDIGEASYDADTALCIEADAIVQAILREEKENDHSK